MFQDAKYQAGDPPGPEGLPPEVIVSPDVLRPQRLPPGQSRTRKWPVLHWGRVPRIPRQRWRLWVRGLVRRELVLTWEQLLAMPQVQVFSDFHCVTRWSRLGNLWQGVSARALLEQAGVLPEARFVVLQGYDDGWTTNVPLEEFLQPDVLLAHSHDGQPLDEDHGGPVRVVIPRLYAWKSAKWIRAIHLLAEDQPGYWERCGYHNHGDPWKEERFG